ncbi:MAG: tetratricopeptide repeat protein [Gemmatimonadota bacterium]|nr:tetratricopeptide repeat protein [Gemmatimonadota bacterium]
MARQIAKESRSGPPPPEDRVTETMVTAAVWAERHRRTLVLAVVAAVALGLAGWAWLDYRGKLVERAATRLDEIRLEAASGAPPSEVKAALATYVEQFGDTSFGNEGRMYLARLQMEERDYAAAIRTLEPAAELREKTPVAFRAAESIAAAEEMRGNPEEAIRWLQRLADAALFADQARRAEAEIARIAAQAGDLERARATYARLVAETAAEDQAAGAELAEWRVRLGEVEAALRTDAEIPAPPVAAPAAATQTEGAPGSEAPGADAPVEEGSEANGA